MTTTTNNSFKLTYAIAGGVFLAVAVYLLIGYRRHEQIPAHGDVAERLDKIELRLTRIESGLNDER